MSKQVEKKRTRLKDKSLLEPPANFDSKKYAGRWISVSKLNQRTDGYEPRGYSIWKDATNNNESVSAGDLVWASKTREDADLDKQELFEAARDQVKSVLNAHKAEDDKLRHAVKGMGGKTSFTYESD